MILPSKFLPADRSLVYVGGEALGILKDGPRSVSEVWEGVRARRKAAGKSIAFDWFILAVTFLFSTGMVELRDGLLTVARPERS